MKMKTGTSMGTIIVTKKAVDKKVILQKKSNARKKRAEICINCSDNKEGYCNKHKSWCGRVNYICLDIKNPYEYKIPAKKKSSDKSLDKPGKRKVKKLRKEFEKNPKEFEKKFKKKGLLKK